MFLFITVGPKSRAIDFMVLLEGLLCARRVLGGAEDSGGQDSCQ